MRDTNNYGFKPDDTVWCMHCERVFYWRERGYDTKGLIECAYLGCDASPWDYSLWDGDFEVAVVYPNRQRVARSEAPQERET